MIIDHLWNERSTLGICGLVHRDWLPSSRYHLFYKVGLSPLENGNFFALLRSPVVTFPPYVTDLSMRDMHEKHWVIDALPLMSGFVGVRYLVLQEIAWSNSRDASLLILATSFPNLAALDLRGVDFDSFDHLVNMVSTPPMLKKLILNGASCANRPITPFIQYPSPHSLQHLKLSSLFGLNGHILTWILHHKSAYVNLSSLSVTLESRDEVTATAALIRTLGPSLRLLRLQMPWKACGCEGK